MMQTVTFLCGHCRKLMAVSTDHLGGQVRCPHCMQVVLTPAPAARPGAAPAAQPAVVGVPPSPVPATAAAPTPAPAPPAAGQGGEDIFSPPDEDDLFGTSDSMRRGLVSPPPEQPAEPDGVPTEPDLPPPVEAAQEPAVTAESGPAAAPLEGAAPGPAEATAPRPASEAGDSFPWVSLAPGAPAPAPAGPEPSPGPGPDLAEGAAAPARKPAPQGNRWFVPLVFVPLVFYALGATFFVAWAIVKLGEAREVQRQGPPNPFEQLPDDGDDRGVTRDGKRITRHVNYPADFATRPLPASQRVVLGKSLRVGAIEVTPLGVERTRVRFLTLGRGPTECRGDSLLLRLKFRNVSADERFAPLDNYFDRWWGGGSRPMPLTQLEAGKDRFCGGPAHWAPPGGAGRELPEWVEGRPPADREGLAPGAASEGFVCTDGNDPRAVRVLFGDDLDGGPPAEPYRGPLLWRVQVRRGLVSWQGRPRSATAVIGVEFGPQDVTAGRPG
jgi:hypothetical protein